jgi:hypothetical protein
MSSTITTLAKTLTTSNPIESMISIARTTNRNVTRWRDGQMVLRWTAAGMLNAERVAEGARRKVDDPKLTEPVDVVQRLQCHKGHVREHPYGGGELHEDTELAGACFVTVNRVLVQPGPR